MFKLAFVLLVIVPAATAQQVATSSTCAPSANKELSVEGQQTCEEAKVSEPAIEVTENTRRSQSATPAVDVDDHPTTASRRSGFYISSPTSMQSLRVLTCLHKPRKIS